MFAFCPKLLILLLSLISSIWEYAAAEPVQYCKFGDANHPNEYVDFCMGLVSHLNSSTSHHDFLLSFTHIRHAGSRRGWTAIGLGSIMKGSLMFIVYGDPMSDQAPLVSIRGATGHHQPTLLTQSDMGGADLRLVEATWVKVTGKSVGTNRDDHIAKFHLICYSCALWPGSSVSSTSNSQPWIWAWNRDQDFPVYSFDATLKMHAHHSNPGGFGNFYVDMARAINDVPGTVSLPPIRPHVVTLGASTFPAGPWNAFAAFISNSKSHLHAILMGTTFFILFPSGVLKIRFGARNAFKYHWIFQLAGSVSIFCGTIIGLLMRRKVDTVHQCIGIAIALLTGLQGFLGWRHHVRFVETGQRTWFSGLHVSLGRLVMVAGWSNVVVGLSLSRHSTALIVTAGVLALLEMISIVLCTWRVRNKEEAVQHVLDGSLVTAQEHGAYFALKQYPVED